MQGRGWRNCVADLQETSPSLLRSTHLLFLLLRPWKNRATLLLAGRREHALLLWALHASRQEGKQGLRRRFVRQLRQKELANGWLGDRLAAHLRSRSSDSGSKRHFMQRSWSDDDRKRNRGGSGHWWAWGLLHEASGPGDHSRPGAGPEDHRGDGGNRSPSQVIYESHLSMRTTLWTPPFRTRFYTLDTQTSVWSAGSLGAWPKFALHDDLLCGMTAPSAAAGGSLCHSKALRLLNNRSFLQPRRREKRILQFQV